MHKLWSASKATGTWFFSFVIGSWFIIWVPISLWYLITQPIHTLTTLNYSSATLLAAGGTGSVLWLLIACNVDFE